VKVEVGVGVMVGVRLGKGVAVSNITVPDRTTVGKITGDVGAAGGSVGLPAMAAWVAAKAVRVADTGEATA
jgi:hypothetical protein